jgi:bifunctional DNA-binding transcriptional regulator/antitoxin component of YhaV-PrlF toxin-antitoxin module
MRKTVVLQDTGEVTLPREILEESHITAGTELVAIARAGQILLLDRQQLHRRLEDLSQRMREGMRTALAQGAAEALFAGLSLEEYLHLSEDEDAALWTRLFQEAERKLRSGEREIPAPFVPAQQKRG